MYQNYGFDKFINRQELRNTIKYVVKSGDTLYSIAEKYNTTVSNIVSLNNLTTTMIYPNQILFIPDKASSSSMTLKDFLLSKNISVEGLSDESLNLILRGTPSCTKKEYIIKYNDTLDTILDSTKLTPYQLIELNNAKWLATGDKIIIG